MYKIQILNEEWETYTTSPTLLSARMLADRIPQIEGVIDRLADKYVRWFIVRVVNSSGTELYRTVKLVAEMNSIKLRWQECGF